MLNLKKLSKAIGYLSILVLILVMTGCSRQQNKQIISNLNNRKADFNETKNNITVKTKTLSKKEFDALFKDSNKKSRKFFLKKYKLIELNIINKSNFPVSLNCKNFRRNQQDTVKAFLENNGSKVASSAGNISKAGTSALALGAGSLAMIFTMAAINGPGSASGIMLIAPVMTMVAILPIAIGAYATKKGFEARLKNKNKRLLKKIEQIILNLNDKYIIKSNRKLKKIFLFEKKNLEEEIKLKLFNEKNEDIKLITEFSIPTN